MEKRGGKKQKLLLLRAKTTNSSLAGIYRPPGGGISASKVMSPQSRNEEEKANAKLQKMYLKEITVCGKTGE